MSSRQDPTSESSITGASTQAFAPPNGLTFTEVTDESALLAYTGVRICAPGNLRAWRTSSTTALLSWDEPYATCNLCPDAIGFEVAGQAMATLNVTHAPCAITALEPDVEYLFHVTAKAAGNNVSDVSSCRLLKLQAPVKPGVPHLLDATPTSLSLSWAPVNPGFEGMRYRVYLNGSLVNQVTQPQVALTHLKSHTEYRVEVRAVNDAGISEPSAATLKTRVRVPTHLRFSQRNGLCRLAWDPVFKQFPSHEISIDGQVFTTAAGRWGFNFRLADVSSGPAPHHLKFAVIARLDGAMSDAASLEITVADDIPPSRPGAPIVSDITDTGATLNWEPSSDDVGVSRYEVLLNGLLVFPTPNTHYTFTQLTSGAYHWVMVRARDKEGNASAHSPITVFKTTGEAPSPRPGPPEMSITALTSTSARLEWQYQDGLPMTGVRILINEEHLKDVLLWSAFTLQNLTPSTEYSISVSAFDAYGQLSEPTLLVYEPRDVTPPSTPGNLRATGLTADSVTLTWEASTDDVGLCEYVIYNNHEYFDSTPLPQYTAVDLLPGTYSFEVCAMDLSGNASPPAALTVHVSLPIFGPPRNFRFSQAGLIFELNWNAPENMGVVLRYEIVLTGPQGTDLTYSTSRSTLRPFLLVRTRYAVKITAFNQYGLSLPLITELTTN